MNYFYAKNLQKISPCKKFYDQVICKNKLSLDLSKGVSINAMSQSDPAAFTLNDVNLFYFLYVPLPTANKTRSLLFAYHFSKYCQKSTFFTSYPTYPKKVQVC